MEDLYSCYHGNTVLAISNDYRGNADLFTEAIYRGHAVLCAERHDEAESSRENDNHQRQDEQSCN